MTYTNPVTSNIWFLVPSGTVSLPDAPTPVVNTTFSPANSATLPGDWDPENPDLDYLFNDILPSGIDTIYPSYIVPGSVIKPYTETVPLLAITRSIAIVSKLSYALVLPSREAALTTRTVLTYTDPSTIIVSAITYSQSSTYVDNTPADNTGMTNGIFAETTQTGTDGGSSWVQMDLGDPKTVTTVYVGTDFTEVMAGGWNRTYTEDCDVEESLDGSTWSVLFNVGTFTSGIQSYSVSTTARYLRIVKTGFLCVTEFYATST